jgi:hypothetical protein
MIDLDSAKARLAPLREPLVGAHIAAHGHWQTFLTDHALLGSSLV